MFLLYLWDDLDKLVRFSTHGSCSGIAQRWAFQQGYIQINVIPISGFYSASEEVVIGSFLELLLVMVSSMLWDTPYMSLINTVFGRNLILLSFRHRTVIVVFVSIVLPSPWKSLSVLFRWSVTCRYGQFIVHQ